MAQIIRRIRIVDGDYDTERIFGTRKPVVNHIDHEGLAIETGMLGFDHTIKNDVSKKLVNKKMTQALLNIAKLPGITLIILYRYDIQVVIGNAYDWDEFQDTIIDNLIRYHYHGNEVEVVDDTTKEEEV